MVLLLEISSLMLKISSAIPGSKSVVCLLLRDLNQTARRNGEKIRFCLIVERTHARESKPSLSVPSGMYVFYSKGVCFLNWLMWINLLSHKSEQNY